MSTEPKCCKQKTYGLAKPLKCNTYKKQGRTSFKPKAYLSSRALHPILTSLPSSLPYFPRYGGRGGLQIRGAGGASPAPTTQASAETQEKRWRRRVAATSCEDTAAVDRLANAGDNPLSASLFMATMGSSPW